MEAAVASRILNVVGSKLALLLIKEYSSIVGVNKDIQELHDKVKNINNWLETVGDKAIGDDPSTNWVKQLKDVVYAVDDVVDDFQLKAEKHDVVGDAGTVSRYMCTKPNSFICKAVRKIKEIKKRFAAIVKQRANFSILANSLPIDHPI
ncbi:hypothetical protein U9M48_034729 [Paspalum notatum var. saurae]|uniref:Disease resistance N-terminal domain-containing protein n=1 Tax=Paspalum notatum var. saurae TaxID=547442 RepID=A0AAQ3X974_PASNO